MRSDDRYYAGPLQTVKKRFGELKMRISLSGLPDMRQLAPADGSRVEKDTAIAAPYLISFFMKPFTSTMNSFVW